MPRCLQVPVKEYRTAAVRPPRSLPKNVQFFRPTACARNIRSARLLSMLSSPCSGERQSAAQLALPYALNAEVQASIVRSLAAGLFLKTASERAGVTYGAFLGTDRIARLAP